MSQPMYVVEYLGAIVVKPRQQYTSASVKALYPTANMMKMKSNNIRVSVDNSDMFPVTYDDESYIQSGRTFIFSEECIIAIGRYVAVT